MTALLAAAQELAKGVLPVLEDQMRYWESYALHACDDCPSDSEVDEQLETLQRLYQLATELGFEG